jgi:hypothetical protein
MVPTRRTRGTCPAFDSMTSIRALLALILLALSPTGANAIVEMKIFTGKGFVGFSVDDNWPVLSMQTELPVAAALFQLPNSADEGTPHSTNLVLMLYDTKSERGRTAFEGTVKQYGKTAPQAESVEGWTIYRQKAKQGDTLYTILDATREDVADVSASVRLAWPHLVNNTATYEAEMESVFRAFLTSVHGSIGPYTPRPGEGIWRPTK